MAEASFTLRAVDATKQAFASVQNSLQGLVQSTKLLSRAVLSGFGFGSVFGIVNALVGKITDRMAEVKKIEEQIQEILKRQLQTQKDLFFEKQKPTDQIELLKKEGKAIQANIDLYAETAAFRQVLVRPEPGAFFDEKKPRGPRMITAALSPEQTLRVTQLGEELSKVQQKIDQINEGLLKSAMTDAESARTNRIKTLNDVLKTQEDAFDAVLQAQQKLNSEFRSAKDKEGAEKKSRQSIADSYESAIDPMFDYANSLKELKGLADDGILTELEYLKAVGLVGDKFVALNEAQKTYVDTLGLTSEEMERLKVVMAEMQMAEDAGNLIAQGFEDAILSGQKLSEVVRSLGRDLLRLVFQQMVTQRLAAGITGVLQGKGIAGFMAAGGPVSAGSPYVVGEQGPELFVPHASGTIVPNNKMSGGGASSGGVTVNYNIAAGVSRAELVPILDQERRRLKAEIPDMVRRGGGYRAAFA